MISLHDTIVVLHVSRVMGKCAFRSLSLSYQKKNWWAGPRQSFFGYDTDYKIALSCFQGLYSVVGVIPKEGLASFGMTPTKILRHIFLWRSSCTYSCDCEKIKYFTAVSPGISITILCLTFICKYNWYLISERHLCFPCSQKHISVHDD